MNTATVESFVVTPVKGSQRSNFIPRHVRGGIMKQITFENTVYGVMDRICAAYKGGSWDFFEVSNGAFFMAPVREAPVEITVEGNAFSGKLAPGAAGVVATLMALSEMTFRYKDDEGLSEAFHSLREYAATREDFDLIFRAID